MSTKSAIESLSGKDESTPWLDHVRQRFSSAVIEIVPDSGHFLQIESADVVDAHLQCLLDPVASTQRFLDGRPMPSQSTHALAFSNS